MPNLLADRCSAGTTLWRFFVVPTILLLLAATASGARADTRTGPATAEQGTRTVSYHGYQVEVPRRWDVVDLDARPHSCVRFDRSVVYLGHAGPERVPCTPGRRSTRTVDPAARRVGDGRRRHLRCEDRNG